MDIKTALEVANMKPSDVLAGQALEVLRDHYLEQLKWNEKLEQLNDELKSHSNNLLSMLNKVAAGEWLDYPENATDIDDAVDNNKQLKEIENLKAQKDFLLEDNRLLNQQLKEEIAAGAFQRQLLSEQVKQLEQELSNKKQNDDEERRLLALGYFSQRNK